MARFYDRRVWRDRVRVRQLTAEPLCERCAAIGETVQAEQVDHRIPISKGGDAYDPRNLSSLCASCHSRKTAVDAGRTRRHGADPNGYPLDVGHPWNQ